VAGDPLWQLHPGEIVVKVPAVNDFGVPGPPAAVIVTRLEAPDRLPGEGRGQAPAG
jgi:hypothetical protein